MFRVASGRGDFFLCIHLVRMEPPSPSRRRRAGLSSPSILDDLPWITDKKETRLSSWIVAYITDVVYIVKIREGEKINSHLTPIDRPDWIFRVAQIRTMVCTLLDHRLRIHPSSADGRIDKESIDAGEESGGSGFPLIRYTSFIPVLGRNWKRKLLLQSSRETKKRRETEFLMKREWPFRGRRGEQSDAATH